MHKLEIDVQEIAKNIEQMIFELSESQDNTKVYRDNITSMKMKIEGNRNQPIRQALLNKQLQIKELFEKTQPELIEFFKTETIEQQPLQKTEKFLQKKVTSPIIQSNIVEQQEQKIQQQNKTDSIKYECEQNVLDVQQYQIEQKNNNEWDELDELTKLREEYSKQQKEFEDEEEQDPEQEQEQDQTENQLKGLEDEENQGNNINLISNEDFGIKLSEKEEEKNGNKDQVQQTQQLAIENKSR